MTNIFQLLLTVTILLSLIGCKESQQIDLIVHNAKIYTVNNNFDIAQAMAIDKGVIIAVGAENEILKKYQSKKKIDAEKRPLYPGFIDAHCHFVGYALNLQQVNLVGTKSFKEVIERVKAFSKNNKSEWIIGRGWDQNDWETKDFPTNEELNTLFPNTPIFLTRIDGHAALANQEALSRAKINHKTKVNGGIITIHQASDQSEINASSSEFNHTFYPKPTGILIDNAVDLVTKIIPKASKETIEEALLTAQKNMFEVGLTTLDDAGLSKDNIELIDKLQQQGKLKIKIYAMISGMPEMLSYYLDKGPYKTPKLNVCSFKFYADGALGSRGACLIKPYADILDNHHHGLLVNEEDFFKKYAPLLAEKGFQMNTHCIGDSANRMILNIYANTLKGTNDKRWRIEHAQVIDSNDFEKFSTYNIIPSIQSTHATSDMYWAQDRLGETRVKNAYAYQKLLQLNGLVALGTDFPVEDINPLNTFYAAVFRKDKSGFPDNGFQMENALSRKEALKGMTIWAALSNFEEQEKGSLEVGKQADFVILNDDLMETKEKNILSIKVISTFINGENVYSVK